MHAEHDIVMANLSVCPSVTCRYCIETNARIIKRFPLPGGVIMLVF